MKKIEISDLKLGNGIALVKPYGKLRTFTQEQLEVDPKSTGGETEAKVETIKRKVNRNMQLVEILNIDPANSFGLVPGDVAMVDYRRAIEFDYFKNVMLVNWGYLIAKVNTEE